MTTIMMTIEYNHLHFVGNTCFPSYKCLRNERDDNPLVVPNIILVEQDDSSGCSQGNRMVYSYSKELCTYVGSIPTYTNVLDKLIA